MTKPSSPASVTTFTGAGHPLHDPSLFSFFPPSTDEAPFLKPHPPSSTLPPLMAEVSSILSLSLPLVLTGLLLYFRSLISMVFLGRLGPIPLAGGSLALGFANITGYSVLSGLAAGMDPICGQAHGARHPRQLDAALRRTVLLLLSASLPISILWLSIRRILLLCRQDPAIAAAANSFILCSLPDLLIQSFLHPLRIFFRSQSITLPITAAAAVAAAFHFPISLLLVSYLRLGIPGVALSSVLSNVIFVIVLAAYLHLCTAGRLTGGLLCSSNNGTLSLHGWGCLLSLAVPSCASVCLEWWWYEILFLLCGLLPRPQSTVAAMGLLIQTTSLIYIFPHSLRAAVSTRVSNELGANRPDRARRAAAVGLAGGALLGLAALSFSFSVHHVWAKMFTGDEEIAKLMAAVLPILGFCELGNCPQTTGCGVLRGSARPFHAAHINLVSFYGVGMPVAVGLAFWAGLDFSGLWLGLFAAQATCLALNLAVVSGTDWDRQARRAQFFVGGSSLVAAGDVNGDEETQGSKPIGIKIEVLF